MSVSAVDTSVIVAGLLSWHEAHGRAHRTLSELVGKPQGALIIAERALIESYAVMTRLPAPHRLRPVDAIALLEGSFGKKAKIVGTKPTQTWKLLRQSVELNVSGGAVYDADIALAAKSAKARILYTLNPRHFRAWATETFEIRIPG